MHRLFLLLCLTAIYDFCNGSNNSDVIIAPQRHVEAIHPTPERTTAHRVQLVPERTTAKVGEETTYLIEEPTPVAEAMTFKLPTDEPEVIFIPNERHVERVEEDFYTPRRFSDILEKKDEVDVLKKAEEESPNSDVIFISKKTTKKRRNPTRRQGEHIDTAKKHIDIDLIRSDEKIIHKKLDCTNLNCQNSVKSVCGGKKENGQYKYRLFLNECFFRKVNCAFTYPENRYKTVPSIRCISVAIHLNQRPTTTPMIPIPFSAIQNEKKDELSNWRSYSSRRSMNLDTDGRFCSHPCPVSCPEDYDPECAVSKSGKTRVFVNHCKLDYDSCFYGEIWQRRPLVDCVGSQKADMQHNRRFIAWMQRVGMVDKKGRLTL